MLSFLKLEAAILYFILFHALGLCPNGIVVVEEPKGDTESETPADLEETDNTNSEVNS